MKTHRKERVGAVVKKLLSDLIARELEFDGALVSITSVVVGEKLERAVVRIAVFPPAYAEKVMRRLHGAQGMLQHMLMKQLNIRPMPMIHFEEDKGYENAMEVEKILTKEQ